MEIPHNLNQFVLSKNISASKAKYVLFGVPDDSGSAGLAHFEGSSQGPNAIREESLLHASFHRTEKGKLKTFIVNSFGPIDEMDIPFVDAGNEKRGNVSKKIAALMKKKQFPIMLGGDHSLAFEALRGAAEVHKKIAVVYFDAHPDFRSSDAAGRKSYATDMYDAVKLPEISAQNSIIVGMRDIESEEFRTMREAKIPGLTSLDVQELGAQKTLTKIKKTTAGLPIYISIDPDVLDLAFGPGVATPSPAGLTSRELLYFITGLAKENVIGMDLVELTPDKDIQHMTAHFCAKIIIEFVVRHFSNHHAKTRPIK